MTVVAGEEMRQRSRRGGVPRQRKNYNVPDTPEARDHAQEARDMDQLLRTDFGIEPEQVMPTRDGRGYIRLTFDDMQKLIDLIDDLEDKVDELKHHDTPTPDPS